jgi:dihydroxyacid dehydratase (EC 4.2.1.9)
MAAMRSEVVKVGVDRTAHRALLKALGVLDEEMGKPFIGIANSYNTIVPGHMTLDKITQAVKEGICSAGESRSSSVFPGYATESRWAIKECAIPFLQGS